MLLKIDAGVNIALGAILLWAPLGSLAWLGLPDAGPHFYAMILGAVLLGVGLALLLEVWRGTRQHAGLGLAGAVMINLCGGLALLGWLIFGKLVLPLRGAMILWVLAILVLAIGILEWRAMTGGWKEERVEEST
jgi:hypothetical protein